MVWKLESSRRNGENRSCPTCGRVFYMSRAQIRKGRGKYCSLECRPQRRLDIRVDPATLCCEVTSHAAGEAGVRFWIGPNWARRQVRLHDALWRQVNAEAPPRTVLLTTCGNAKCINPGHVAPRPTARGANARGAGNTSAVLNDAKVSVILALRGRASAEGLSWRYGVCRDLIRKIWRRALWGHVEPYSGDLNPFLGGKDAPLEPPDRA